MAVIDVVELEVVVASAAVALLGVVPVGGQVSAIKQSQRAYAARGQRLMVAAAADVERLLVQEGVFGVGRDRVVTLGGRLAGNPLPRHEQAHRTLAFVVQRARRSGVFGWIEVATTRRRPAKAARQMAVARQRLRQRRQQRRLCFGRQVQSLEHARRLFQLHVLQGHAHRRQSGRAAEQLDVELFGLAFNQILKAGGDAAGCDQGAASARASATASRVTAGACGVIGVPLQ